MGSVPTRLPWFSADDGRGSLKLVYELGGEEFRALVTQLSGGPKPWRLHVTVLLRSPDPMTEARHEFHTGWSMTAEGARQMFRRWLIRRNGAA